MKKKQLLLLIPLLTSPMYTNGMEETQKLLEAKKSATSKYNAEKTKELKELISPPEEQHEDLKSAWPLNMLEVLVPVWDQEEGPTWDRGGFELSEKILKLILQGADPNTQGGKRVYAYGYKGIPIDSQEKSVEVGGWTPLMVVATWGPLNWLKELIGVVPSILTEDVSGKTAYDYARLAALDSRRGRWDQLEEDKLRLAKDRLDLLSKESFSSAAKREARRLKAKITSPLKPR